MSSLFLCLSISKQSCHWCRMELCSGCFPHCQDCCYLSDASNPCQEDLPLFRWASYESCFLHNSHPPPWNCSPVQWHGKRSVQSMCIKRNLYLHKPTAKNHQSLAFVQMDAQHLVFKVPYPARLVSGKQLKYLQGPQSAQVCCVPVHSCYLMTWYLAVHHWTGPV